jgi:hypothetical protein
MIFRTLQHPQHTTGHCVHLERGGEAQKKSPDIIFSHFDIFKNNCFRSSSKFVERTENARQSDQMSL